MKKEETRKLIPLDRFVTVGHSGPEQSAIEIGESFLIEVVKTINHHESAMDQISNAICQADGVLILSRGENPTGYGSLWVRQMKVSKKPSLIVDPSDYSKLDLIANWITNNSIHSLAIGGPKEMKHRSLYAQSSFFLGSVLNHLIGARVFLPTGVAGKIEHSLEKK